MSADRSLWSECTCSDIKCFLVYYICNIVNIHTNLNILYKNVIEFIKVFKSNQILKGQCGPLVWHECFISFKKTFAMLRKLAICNLFYPIISKDSLMKVAIQNKMKFFSIVDPTFRLVTFVDIVLTCGFAKLMWFKTILLKNSICIFETNVATSKK